jgi:hypothetical protein
MYHVRALLCAGPEEWRLMTIVLGTRRNQGAKDYHVRRHPHNGQGSHFHLVHVSCCTGFLTQSSTDGLNIVWRYSRQ